MLHLKFNFCNLVWSAQIAYWAESLWLVERVLRVANQWQVIDIRYYVTLPLQYTTSLWLYKCQRTILILKVAASGVKLRVVDVIGIICSLSLNLVPSNCVCRTRKLTSPPFLLWEGKGVKRLLADSTVVSTSLSPLFHCCVT